MDKISDNIDFNWLEQVEELAEKIENGDKVFDRFTDDQLHYLIYWNFGYSGITTSDYTIMCEDELNNRGIRYSHKLAELIVDTVEELY